MKQQLETTDLEAVTGVCSICDKPFAVEPLTVTMLNDRMVCPTCTQLVNDAEREQ